MNPVQSFLLMKRGALKKCSACGKEAEVGSDGKCAGCGGKPKVGAMSELDTAKVQAVSSAIKSTKGMSVPQRKQVMKRVGAQIPNQKTASLRSMIRSFAKEIVALEKRAYTVPGALIGAGLGGGAGATTPIDTGEKVSALRRYVYKLAEGRTRPMTGAEEWGPSIYLGKDVPLDPEERKQRMYESALAERNRG